MVEVVRDKAFARRLHQAAEDRPDVPPFGLGRQTWIKERMGVSHEAVRKWLTGESRPRPATMKKLAALLGVDEAWLSLGVSPDLQPKEREARNALADGAVNVFTGLVQMNGGHVAFPGPDDPRGDYVDLYAIIRGAQYSVHVTPGEGTSIDVFKFRVPKEYPHCSVVGVIHTSPMHCVFISMRLGLLEKLGIRRGGHFEVIVHHSDGKYTTGSDEWPILHALTDRL